MRVHVNAVVRPLGPGGRRALLRSRWERSREVQAVDGPSQNPSSSTELVAGFELVMPGSPEPLAAFPKAYA
jgi:hypothetical protein